MAKTWHDIGFTAAMNIAEASFRTIDVAMWLSPKINGDFIKPTDDENITLGRLSIGACCFLKHAVVLAEEFGCVKQSETRENIKNAFGYNQFNIKANFNNTELHPNIAYKRIYDDKIIDYTMHQLTETLLPHERSSMEHHRQLAYSSKVMFGLYQTYKAAKIKKYYQQANLSAFAHLASAAEILQDMRLAPTEEERLSSEFCDYPSRQAMQHGFYISNLFFRSFDVTKIESNVLKAGDQNDMPVLNWAKNLYQQKL